jgi:hypothetical protein
MRNDASQAAALALMGWYLMVPPSRAVLSHTEEDLSVADKNYIWKTFPEFNLSIAKWDIYESFDSADKCMEDIDRNATGADQYLKKHPDLRYHSSSSYLSIEYDHQRWLVAKCIGTDDPRLKGN